MFSKGTGPGSGSAGISPAFPGRLAADREQTRSHARNLNPGKGKRDWGKSNWYIALLLAALMTAASTARATPPAPPLVVEADHSTAIHHADSDTGQVTYSGHVVITHGPAVIHGAHAVVYTDHQHLVKAVVTGSPTQFTYRPGTGLPVHGKSDKITYLMPENLVVLEGDATLHRGKEIFRAAVVRYDLDTQLLKARGQQGGRVHVVIPAEGSAGGP